MQYQLARATRDTATGVIKKGMTFWVIAGPPKKILIHDNAGVHYTRVMHRTHILPYDQPLALGIAIDPDQVELLPTFADNVPRQSYDEWYAEQEDKLVCLSQLT